MSNSLFSLWNAGLFSALLLLSLSSCKQDPKFSISGDIYGAEGRSVVVEKSDFAGHWIPVDSTRVSSTGSFSLKVASPGSPEIYRLALGSSFVYFPVDSVEHIVLSSSADKFGREFSLSGSQDAERLAAFEKKLQKLNFNNPDSVKAFKRNVYSEFIRDGEGSILSYYILTKTSGSQPLYNPADPEDARYYAAVATQFLQYRPGDPHAGMLEQVSKEALRRRKTADGQQKVIEASEISMIDIALDDENGRCVKLSDIVGRGEPAILLFSMMNEPESPAFNRGVSDILKSRPSLRVYHVSFDEDRYAWREAAANLPWTTVIDPLGMHSSAASDYNVAALPAIFIYDRAGNLVDRADDFNDLSRKLSKI